MGILFVVCLFWWYIFDGNADPQAVMLAQLFKAGMVITGVCWVVGFYRKHKVERAAHKQTKAKENLRKTGGVGWYPELKKDKIRGLYTDENRKKLSQWNAAAFRMHPKYIYPGPEREDGEAKWLRFSLFTPEQLATVPFENRVYIRNKARRSGSSYDSGPCFVCGASRDKCQSICSECHKRYEKDVTNGWEKTIPDGIDKYHVGIKLWEYQQAIAVDLSDGVITKEIAQAEMQEAIGLVRQRTAELQAEEAARRTRCEQKTAEQQKWSNIARNLSS